MRIEVKYSVSTGTHPVEISEADLEEMRRTGELTVSQETPKGTKTVSITGSVYELTTLAAALLNHVLDIDTFGATAVEVE
jgi:hypothetical protein